MLWGMPQNEPCAPDFPVHTRWVVCSTSITPGSSENYLGSFIFFKILLMWGYWGNEDDPDLELLGSLL